MAEQLTIELAACEATLLREIADTKLYRKDIAVTYRQARLKSGCDSINWLKVNRAIIDRWGRSGFEYIERLAWGRGLWKDEPR